MTRRVHSNTTEGKETPRAAAYAAYRDLGPGRNLSKLRERFVAQAAEARQNHYAAYHQCVRP
jgi:hypothetical protein